MPTMPVTPPDDRTLLLVIIIIAAGAVVILVAGGVFIIIVTVVIKRRTMGKNGRTTPTEVRNALYCELNDVDVSNASTVVKPHTYRELERHTGPIPPPPHFALSTGSAMSLSSHQGRPLPPNTSVSGPVQGGAASIQRILEPGAHSMHFPRTSATFAQGREIRGGSLHGTRVGANYRPPIPPGMQPQHSENGRRGSVPLKIWRQSHQQQHQILLPGKSMPVLSSTPVPSPPTPQMTDPPVPYLTPERPWYNSDYELTNNPVKTLPEEEGLYVPTMEERKSLGKKIEDYSRLRHPRHSLHCNGDVVFFDEPDVFEEPASSTSEIYQQLSSRKFREIIRHYITIQDHVGSGHFALVHRGIWRTPQGEREVAVKELKKSAEEENRVKFLQEAVIMGQFNHNNVVKLYGVVTIDEPLMIVMELMPNGDLKNYLDQFSVRRSSQRHSTSCTPPPSPVAIPPSLPAQLLSFCRQIADGMDYLSSKNFVHRDLAARNVFLTRDFACKIGDFGLARDLGEEDVYLSRGGKVPIKWTAPEALQYREYTSASDVWSYGMVLFEIWSLGHRPFDACTLENDVRKVMEGSVCQPPPPGCPRALYQLMVHCWHYDPTNRPSFSSVCEYLNSSDSDLLKLPRELPPSVSPQATQLGAPLSEAKGLYSDLQYCYDESIV